MTTVQEVVGSPDRVMGAKAVFGPISSHVLCFGGRGESTEKRFYSQPAGAAKRAVNAPWVFAIGGGSKVRDNLGGKVVNLVRVSCVYGDTAAFVSPAEAERLAQWPAAVALHDVWELDGHPHLVDDLGLPDRRILAGAVDGIIKPEQHFDAFWKAVRDWPVTLKPLPLPLNFYDSGVPRQVNRMLPTLKTGTEEGKAAWKLQRSRERDRALSRAAKVLNVGKFGVCTCEACQFAHSDLGLFDAHHPNPLCAGIRTTLAEHLVVLCPTCHRRAHRKDPLSPFTLDELKEWNRAGRP
ncbi:hypothetical protein [Novosphingobium mangrovi (ex Hu et al. 2023)]|uniref:HNH domain-containing protein n=1 Tax=Novosphingobium mangrovi (ex Hu et al. 2023) TaxID=2930094 RepID=A0ABT0AEI4_9SPHN|nr:hypothetical protein [Novosphingobium mangrovi (ex Hu et al. 2023)]MCJ1961608.1 hypothetical protein [Novosphingobium mangrovi (ex Hu et al. 2023)]